MHLEEKVTDMVGTLTHIQLPPLPYLPALEQPDVLGGLIAINLVYNTYAFYSRKYRNAPAGQKEKYSNNPPRI